jgi:tRNA(Ile)-lysidine synthase
MLSRILATIREQGLLAKGGRVLVAISGGPDSTALLHSLVKLAGRLHISLAAVVVDHRLRPDSAAEAAEVCRRCARIGIGCEVVTVDVARARRPHVSAQEAAREVRLAALEEAAIRLGCAKIALGHTADDQAETVLFRILRGTGLAGLAGIPYRRGPFIRPLIEVRRAQVLAYLARRKLEFFSDPSNANRRYTRSRIRHDLLPALAQENPRVVEALLGLARAARSRAEPAPSWRESLPADLYLPRRAAEAVERMVRLARDGAGSRTVTVKGGIVMVAEGAVTWVPCAAGKSVAPDAPSPEPQTIAGPGQYRILAPPAFAVEILPAQAGAAPGGNAACFDVAKVPWPLCLRPPRPGDRMAPRGGRGTRKLSDLLIDAKIPRATRATLPVLCDGAGTILFVPGLRPSESGRPDRGTREWFEVRVSR